MVQNATAPGRVAAPWLALLAAPLSFGIGAPALVLPDIARDTGTAVASATWVVTAFGWGISVGTPLLAGLLARRGLRVTLATCAMLVLVGVVLVNVVPTLAVVALGTALQGLGTAGLLACAMTLADGAQTMGLISAGLAAVGATGPLVGSLVGGLIDWRASLALPALSLLALPAALRRAGSGGPQVVAPFDATGAVLLMALVTALVAVPHRPVPAAIAAALVAAALAWHLRRRPDGFLPAVLVRSPAFLLAAGTALFLAIVNFGLFYAAPTLLAWQTGWPPATVGAVMLWPYLLGGSLSWAVVALTARLRLRPVHRSMKRDVCPVHRATASRWWRWLPAGPGAFPWRYPLPPMVALPGFPAGCLTSGRNSPRTTRSASAARLIAALKSRSSRVPQDSQTNCRSARVSLALTTPHVEQVLLEGYHRSAKCSRAPAASAL
jgi:DHA2 family metal-tetracycline-proton antiporter-like MFS transporter